MNIERMQPADFDAVYRLLTQSFPATERRGAAGQRALFSDSAYRVDILRAPDGGVQALIASWDFDDFVFLEHFAVDPACRSGGIGVPPSEWQRNVAGRLQNKSEIVTFHK